jgi:hypothetical protein
MKWLKSVKIKNNKTHCNLFWIKLPEWIKTNDLDGITEQKLISVSKNKLIVSIKDQGSVMIMGMKKQ